MRHFLYTLLLCSIVFRVTAQRFKVSYTAAAYQGPFTGNVLLCLSKKNELPKNQLSSPCYRIQVRDIRPGEAVVFSDLALSYPTILSRIARGDYYVQAVWDLNAGDRVIGLGTGNPYSTTQKIHIGDTAEIFHLTCDQAVPGFVFKETRFVKEIKAPSALLSRFHQKNSTLNAAVILPPEYYDQPARQFPVYFTVGGYGSSYHHYSASESSDTLPATPLDTTSCIKVYLDGDVALGHSCYANSDNNGPVGDAFVQEFIPFLEQQFRCNGARLIRGHSSGGWTVVYLLTHYPAVFAGGNASAPDPVDFHRFTLTNLYTDDKRVEFVDALTIGQPRDSTVVFDRPNIVHSIEDIYYRGQQNVSFDAVFGPKGPDGLPVPLFNTATGKLNRAVFRYWQRYDLTQYAIQHRRQLKKELGEKLRISVGTEDNAYLNFSVMLMEKQMKKYHIPIRFAYYPGTHFTVTTPAYKNAEAQFLEQQYLLWLKHLPGMGIATQQ